MKNKTTYTSPTIDPTPGFSGWHDSTAASKSYFICGLALKWLNRGRLPKTALRLQITKRRKAGSKQIQLCRVFITRPGKIRYRDPLRTLAGHSGWGCLLRGLEDALNNSGLLITAKPRVFYARLIK